MKRRTLKFIACAAVMALTLSVTACGGSDDSKSGSTPAVEDTNDDVSAPEVEEDTDTEEPEVEAEEEEEVDGFSTLEDYYNEYKSTLDSVWDSMGQEGMEVAVEVNGNEFIVIIKITDSSMIVDGMGDALDDAIAQQADTFKAQAAQFDEAIGQEGACTVTMRYLDPDDNVLSENSFTAN